MHPVLELKPAFRDGQPIGNGVFVPPNSRIGAGAEVAAYVRGAYKRARDWEPYCAERGLDSTWAGFATTRTVAKALAHVYLYDPTWANDDTRPLWSYLNHSAAAPTCKAVKPAASGGDVVRFKALRDLEAGEELTYKYGGNTADWDDTEVSSAISQRHIIPSRTRSGKSRSVTARPY